MFGIIVFFFFKSIISIYLFFFFTGDMVKVDESLFEELDDLEIGDADSSDES